MSKRFGVLVLLTCVFAIPSFGGSIPSNASLHPDLNQRTADLALVRSIAGDKQVATVLARHGLTQKQIAALAAGSPSVGESP